MNIFCLDHSQIIMNSGRDFDVLQSKYPIETTSSSQRQFIRTRIERDINGLRGSMSSSTSSIQNNMVKKSRSNLIDNQTSFCRLGTFN